MKNLGKILLLLYLIQTSLMADILASVDTPTVERGEMVTYEIMLNGDNIKRPTILTLCGENVISTGSQTSIQMINGTMTKSYIFTYKFLPQKSCVIDPIEVEIDSKIVKTKSVEVKVSKLKVQKDSPFILTLQTNKKEVFVGEPFEMTLLFKQHNSAEAIDSEFIAPTFTGFWIKEETKPKRYKKGDYTILEKKYILAAQRVGTLKISSAQMRIAYRTHTRDPWAGVISRIKWKSYYSNELSMGVKSIPNGLSLVGDFSISAEVDKTSINANEAVNISIRVLGDGNLEDIQSFKPSIDGVNIFDEKITIVDDVLMQKMAFVSESTFTIPPFTLKFFNTKTNKVTMVQTKPFTINVHNSKASKEIVHIQKDETQKEEAMHQSGDIIISSMNNVFIFLAGLFLGLLLAFIKPWKSSSKSKKAFNIKDEKMLLVKLLPYEHDAQVKEVLDILESNLYSNRQEQVDRKLLKELIKRYDIS